MLILIMVCRYTGSVEIISGISVIYVQLCES